MMDDLISRQAAIKILLEFFVEFLGGTFHENAQKELIARFQRLPSAQPGIIRCKDCKHYIDHKCYERNHINIGLFVHDNNYCGWGEQDERDS